MWRMHSTVELTLALSLIHFQYYSFSWFYRCDQHKVFATAEIQYPRYVARYHWLAIQNQMLAKWQNFIFRKKYVFHLFAFVKRDEE